MHNNISCHSANSKSRKKLFKRRQQWNSSNRELLGAIIAVMNVVYMEHTPVSMYKGCQSSMSVMKRVWNSSELKEKYITLKDMTEKSELQVLFKSNRWGGGWVLIWGLVKV